MEKHNPIGDALSVTTSSVSSLKMSRNEITSLCSKAARGAGMSWGLAEEAGQAAAWLTARGLPGPEDLASHLSVAAGQSWENVCPQVSPGNWTTRTGTPLCPIALGATLSDFASTPERPLSGDGIKTGPVSHPLLVLPFLASAAAGLNTGITLSSDIGSVAVDGTGKLFGDIRHLQGRSELELRVRQETNLAQGEYQPIAGSVGVKAIEKLNDLALKTTVPPSERSREGAGAGKSDND